MVSSSASGQRREGHADGAVEAARLVVDFGGVAGDRDQVAAIVAEIDVALDQAQLLILGTLAHSPAAHSAADAERVDRQARQPRIPQRARGAHFRLLLSSRVTCQYQPDSGNSNSGSPIDCGNLSAPSSGDATSATSVRR